MRHRWHMSALIVGLVLWASVAGLTQAQNADRRLAPTASGGRRVALVIGNDTYAAAPLKNARNDARAMAAALRDLGFTVTQLSDARRSELGAALETFARDLTANDVALFYYAGHGVQLENENYLVPVDFTGQTEATARWDTIPVGRVHDSLRRARVSMIVLDACRNNPYGGSRSAGGGLAAMEARGSLIAFAAGAGQTASDNGLTGNGLFTAHLLSALRVPGLGVREVFRRAREQVVAATGGNQFPAVYDGLVGDFVFRVAGVAPPAVGSSSREDLARREELAFWESISETKDPAAKKALLSEYLRVYPQGRFGVLARARLIEVSGTVVRESISGTIKLRSDQVQSAALADLVSDCAAGHWLACARAASLSRNADAAQSLRLAERGCDGGSGLGCSLAGFAYNQGLGVEKDSVKSNFFYERGCDVANLVACVNLGLQLQQGEGSDLVRAVTLFRKACDAGNNDGCNQLGYLYQVGAGVEKNDAQATPLFQKACDGGHAAGCSNLGQAFEYGRAVPLDRVRALELYQKACKGGSAAACEYEKKLRGQ